MSYCRFQNTVQDLNECFDEILTMTFNNGKDDDGEKLSQKEFNSMRELITVAQAISEQFKDEDDLDTFLKNANPNN